MADHEPMRRCGLLIGSLGVFPSVPRAPAVAPGASEGTLRLCGSGL